MQLRYYQRDAVAAAYQYCQDNPGKNPCIVLPTGGGKTHLIVQICRDVQKWGGRVLIVAHVKELLQQAHDKLESVNGLDIGIYSASLNRRDTQNDVIIAGVQSIYRRGLELCGTRPFNIVIVDEAHRIPTEGEGMYVQLLGDLCSANPKLRVIGLTATPYRTGEGLVCRDDHFLNGVCYEADIKELIAGGFLCPLVSKRSLSEIDMVGVKISRGDFVQSEMENRFLSFDKVDIAVDELIRLTAGRNKVLVFCCGIAHASSVAIKLEEAGQSVRVVSSEHPGRDGSIEAFRSGQCKYLVNVNVLTEGFDVTSIDAVVLLRATVSPGLYYQMVGRGLRVDPAKKDCLVLDYGGNVARHGTIDNLNLTRGGLGDGSGEAPVKMCPQCRCLMHAALMACTDCGHVFPEPEVNHESQASGESPIGEDWYEQRDVTCVSYTVHKKRGADDSAPRTVRVTYYDHDRVAAEEWICVEHTGFAYEKAYGWWSLRCREPMPTCAEDAVQLAQQGHVAEPKAIDIRHKSGTKFPTIVDYKNLELPKTCEEEEVPW